MTTAEPELWMFDLEYTLVGSETRWRPAMSTGANERDAMKNFRGDYSESMGTIAEVRHVRHDEGATDDTCTCRWCAALREIRQEIRKRDVQRPIVTAVVRLRRLWVVEQVERLYWYGFYFFLKLYWLWDDIRGN